MNVANLQKINKSTLVSVFINTFISTMKLTVGFFSGSHAMVVDGVHSLSDLLTDFFVLFIAKVAHEAPDENHAFGHGKIESFGTMALGGTLLLVSGAMAYDSLLRIREVAHYPASYAIYFALMSIVFKEFLFRYLIKVADEMNSEILKANAWHSRFDAFSSAVVLVGLLGAKAGMPWMDSFAGFIISIMIARVGVAFAWPAMKDLADTSLPREQTRQLLKIIKETPGVLDTHNFRTRKIGNKVFIDINIQVNERITVSEGHEIAAHVLQNLKSQDKKIEDVTVHIDIENDMALDYYQSDARKSSFLRDQLEKMIYKEWSSVGLELNLINKIELHYLNQGIEIEIFLAQRGSLIPSELVVKINSIAGVRRLLFWESAMHS